MNFPRTEIPTGVSQWAVGDANAPFPEIANFNFVVCFRTYFSFLRSIGLT